MKWLILVAFAFAGTARMSVAVADTESTVTCKDGTTSKGGKGACSHHGGVAAGASAPAPSSAPATKPAPAPSSAPASTPMVKCKDGSESKGGKGACSHHGGVAAGGAAEMAPPAGAPAPAPAGTQGRSAPPSPRPSSSGAAPQAGQPTARCKDNSISYSVHHAGACSHHGGVAQWLQ
jgi:hypothetical protein